MASKTSCTFGCKSVLLTRGQAPRSVLTVRGLATPACSAITLRVACGVLSLSLIHICYLSYHLGYLAFVVSYTHKLVGWADMVVDYRPSYNLPGVYSLESFSLLSLLLFERIFL